MYQVIRSGHQVIIRQPDGDILRYSDGAPVTMRDCAEALSLMEVIAEAQNAPRN